MQLDQHNLVSIAYPDTVGKHVAILGKTGSGKTNTGYVWAEEELRAGGLLTIIDPEGDYFHLRNEFPVLIIGCARRGNPIDLEVSPDQAERIAEALTPRHLIVIADLSGFDEEQKDTFVTGYLKVLWRQYQFEDMPPQHLLIDETQLFAPQNGKPASKHVVKDIARRGRKRGLALIVATQRPQDVEKAVLDATDIRFLLRVQRGRALKAYDDLLPGTIPNVKDTVPGLLRGQAVFMNDDVAQIIQVRPSSTFSSEARTVVDSRLQPVDGAFLAELRALLTQDSTPPESAMASSPGGEVDRLKARIAELEAERDKWRSLAHKVVFPTPNRSELEERVAVLEAENAALKQAAATVEVLPAAPAPQSDWGRETDEEPIRSGWALKLARGKQEKRFDMLLRDLCDYPPFQLRILRFLTEREGLEYTSRELARHLGLSQSTIENKPPLQLVRRGLLVRPHRSTPNIYRSTVGEFIRKEYPDLDADQLTEKLIGVCNKKMLGLIK